ncbi:thioredoxin family protein [Alloalcanivorax gelatiniphagus]|uniref:Thioredoxin family protein n=1 Tax=Alloalcanivorax gelatiniphagus TaxID=1194167 RepID=A0ABY2XRX6_9GAMM|nr:thioredoxin family protein [Alloalcanivorax gelatiniphagus]TMW14638.1 thioredoxin family protein [Alloalcanivorax gelatiniphagus]|tara:strand:+ start:32403 stop:32759 length:357 start_codon:yes stop_codon:yes gene_type:complete
MYSAEYATNHPTRDEIQGIAEPTVLEFGSPDCPYCQKTEPMVKAAFQDFPGISHVKLADHQDKMLGRAFNVDKWPTLIFIQEGREVSRLVRPENEDAIRDRMEDIDANPARSAQSGGS